MRVAHRYLSNRSPARINRSPGQQNSLLWNLPVDVALGYSEFDCVPEGRGPFGAKRRLRLLFLYPGCARKYTTHQHFTFHEQKRDFYISEISFNEENLSLIREICLNVLWFEKYIVNDGTPNNMRGESINITPARNKDGIVITCITQ